MNKWISYHIFCFDGRIQEKIICNCIAPLMEQLLSDGKIEKWFFIRYWEGGPHIRLRFLENDQCAQEVLDILNDFVGQNKSNSTLTKDQYYANHSFDGEQMDPSKLPWYGDNTIVEIDYEREYERYGGEKTIPYCENIFMKSSQIAGKIIENTADNFSGRMSIAVNLIMIFLEKFNIKSVYFFYYYKKVWDDFFNNSEMKSSYITRLNIEKRLQTLDEKIESNGLYKQWSDCLDEDATIIKEICKDNPEKIYGLAISLVHMFNNRLGIVPEIERQISAQFVREAEELGYVMESKQAQQ